MHVDDLFQETSTADPWGSPTLVVRTELLTALRAGPIPGEDDLSSAIAATRLVRSELEAYGTAGGERLTEEQIELAQRALRSVLERLGITLNLPWRNFAGFRSYQLKNDGYGSWQARRDLLDTFFDLVQEELDRQEEAQFRTVLAEAVSPHGATGWPKVDEELTELKRRFRSATSPPPGLPRRRQPERRRTGGSQSHGVRPHATHSPRRN